MEPACETCVGTGEVYGRWLHGLGPYWRACRDCGASKLPPLQYFLLSVLTFEALSDAAVEAPKRLNFLIEPMRERMFRDYGRKVAYETHVQPWWNPPLEYPYVILLCD